MLYGFTFLYFIWIIKLKLGCCQFTSRWLTQSFVSPAAGPDSVQRLRSRPAEALLGPRHDEPRLGVQGEDRCRSQPAQRRHWNSQGRELCLFYSRVNNMQKRKRSAFFFCINLQIRVIVYDVTCNCFDRIHTCRHHPATCRGCCGNSIEVSNCATPLVTWTFNRFPSSCVCSEDTFIKSQQAFVWTAKNKSETRFDPFFSPVLKRFQRMDFF